MASSAFPDLLYPGDLINDRFQVVRELGQGKKVWEAIDAVNIDMGRVTLKFVYLDRGESIQHYCPPAALRVINPHVCRVLEIAESSVLANPRTGNEEEAGPPFIVMEYVAGESLADLISRIGTIPINKGLDIAIQICDGLRTIHQSGIVHSHLTLGNVFLDSHSCAKIINFLAELEREESIHGKNVWPVAPEVLHGETSNTVLSDIYALGVLFFELFSGLPLGQEHKDFPKALLSQIPHQDGLRDLVAACVAPDPRERPDSVGGILEELKRIYDSHPMSNWAAISGRVIPARPELVLRELLDRNPWSEIWLAANETAEELRILNLAVALENCSNRS